MKRSCAVLTLAMALTGCEPKPPPPPPSERCESPAEYIAFDVTNHAPQDLRLQRMDEIVALFDATSASGGLANKVANADAALAKYQGTDANLQVKVQGRTDVHFDPPTAVGAELDAAIVQSIEALRTAPDAQAVKLAKQRLQKAGFHRFVFLSVMQELYAPTKKHYDEAFGYLGTGATNAEAGVRGMAALAKSRDANNGTTVRAELFQLILDGACAIEKALGDRESMTVGEDAEYKAIVDAIDGKLQQLFAYSVGHELFDVANPANSAADDQVKLHEGDGFFRAIEPLLLKAGGTRAQLATGLRSALDTAKAAATPSDNSWVTAFDPNKWLADLEAAYGIDVKA